MTLLAVLIVLGLLVMAGIASASDDRTARGMAAVFILVGVFVVGFALHETQARLDAIEKRLDAGEGK